MILDYLNSLPNALNLGLIWCVAGIGVYLTYKILDIPDLTVDGSFVLGAYVSALVLRSGGHFVLAMLLGFLAGIAAGIITGLLHTFLGIPPILSGILTQIALWSVNLILADGSSLVSFPLDTQVIFSMRNIYDTLWKSVIIIAVIIGLLYLFFGTQLGTSIRATGNNQKMSKAHGINTKLNIVICLALSNGIVALAGTLLAQYNGYAEINMGRGTIVTCLAAIVIGGLIFNKFAKNFAVRLSSVVAGSIIYFIIYQTVIFFDFNPNLMKLLTAVVVALFLGIPYIQRTYFGRYKKWRINRRIKKSGGEE